MLGTILIVILILALFGGLSQGSTWGYAPSGGIGLVLLIVIILLVCGRL